MIKAAIFDMDGVIIDSEPIYYNLSQKHYKELGITLSQEEYNSYVGTTSFAAWGIFKEKYNLKNTLEELILRASTDYVEYLNLHCNDIKPMEGIEKFIIDLRSRGLKLAIASSSSIEAIETVVRIFGFEKYFDFLVTGESVKRSKPEPDIFLQAAKVLDVMPEDCFVIEDSSNGAKAAKKAGMKCIGFKNLNSGNQDLSMADIIIDSFADIDFGKVVSLYNPK